MDRTAFSERYHIHFGKKRFPISHNPIEKAVQNPDTTFETPLSISTT